MTKLALLVSLLVATGLAPSELAAAATSGTLCAGRVLHLSDQTGPRPPKARKVPEQFEGAPGGAPTAADPGAGSPTATTGAGPAGLGPGGLGTDLTLWSIWWFFNREPYYNLRQRFLGGDIHRGGDDFYLGRGQAATVQDARRPTEAMIRGLVVPALLHVLETERNNDLIAGTLIALAKIGDGPGTRPLRGVFVPCLRRGEQRISETAVLALGILGDEEATPLLASLMHDDERGRRRLGGKVVPVRTRTFAAYGLGLIGHRSTSEELREGIVSHLVDVLELGQQARPDLKVAALAALGVVPLDWTSPLADPRLPVEIAQDRASVLRFLIKRLDTDTRGDRGFPDSRVRAHVPTAIARLLSAEGAGGGAKADMVRGECVDALLRIVAKHSNERKISVVQSATIALGVIGNSATGPDSIGEQNERMFAELRRIAKYSASGQSEFFALIALAQVGGRRGPGPEPFGLRAPVQKELLTALERGKGQKKPWAAIALGVFGSALREETGVVDGALVAALRKAAREGNRPDEAGAYAIALGLIRDLESEQLLLDRLAYFSQDDTRGQIAVGLGLMRAARAAGTLMALLEESLFRPELVRQAALGTALLGDRSAVQRLVEMLRAARGYSAQAAIAAALGRIGDRDAVAPLVTMLLDQRITDSARSVAAVALGMACDKDDLPWNVLLAVNINYRADVSTATNQLGTGILDFL